MLYAVLLHRIHDTDDFPRRLRTLRNLLEASDDEIRPERMPRIASDVYRIIVDADLEAVEALNQAQLADELEKRDFLGRHPDLLEDLLRLEDHYFLRGSLMVFELDESTFRHRADAFRDLFSDPDHLRDLTGALLATGEYHRRLGRSYRFGTPEYSSRWRELLTGTARANLETTRTTLGSLLDQVADSVLPTGACLGEIQQDWLAEKEAIGLFDWRYYLVKYGAMREGKSGIYFTPGDELEFSLCMLNMQQLNSYYRDPFLLAIARASNAQEAVTGGVEGGPDGPWFTGFAATPRWMRLKTSGVGIQCTNDGFLVESPEDDRFSNSFEDICARHDIVSADDGTHLLAVPDELDGERRFDTSDRIEMGAALLRDLIGAGL